MQAICTSPGAELQHVLQDFKMAIGKQYHRIDGHVSPAKRDAYIQDFGNPRSPSQVWALPPRMPHTSCHLVHGPQKQTY